MNSISPSPSELPVKPHRYDQGQPVKPSRVHVIINPTAGQDQPILRELNRVFKENDVEWEAFITKDAGDARRFARQSAQGGADVVVACGGDGTVMETAAGLRGTGVPMAILPAGTANVMSIELGIPALAGDAVEFVANGRNQVRYIDMGVVGEQEFLLRVGVGLEANMAIETPREAKTRWGNLAYAFTMLSSLTNPPLAHYSLVFDGEKVEVDGISLMIGNSSNVGFPGVNLVQGTDISDGRLDAILVRSTDLPSLLAIATNSLISRSETPPEPILHWQAAEITVTADPVQSVQADGEEIARTPFTARVLPQAVSILVPLPPEEPQAE